MNNTKIDRFWKDYIGTIGKMGKLGMHNSSYTTWDFGGDKSFADKLCKLVLQGNKTATVDLYIKGNMIPKVGDKSIIIDFQGNPICVIEYTKVEVKQMDKVNYEFIKKEGEGFISIEDWQLSHMEFFQREYKDTAFESLDTLLIVLEEFKVVYPVI